MNWSKYNRLFESQRHGYLLYNSLTNSFAQLDAATYDVVRGWQECPEEADITEHPALYVQLAAMKVLVEEGEEEELLNLFKYRRHCNDYGRNSLGLTIAPTLFCNLNCTYCYQEHRRPVYMDEATEDRVIEFIKGFGRPRYLSVTWFGGEPLLHFGRVCSLTEKIQALGIPFFAGMITNATLLDKEKIARLEDLKVKSMQVTIDGPREVHDQRRVTASGKGTFDQIVENLDALVAGWGGRLNIRVNVDQENRGSYHSLHASLKERFPDKKVAVYPGIVYGVPEGHPDVNCLFSKRDEVDFAIEQYREHGVTDAPRYYYPKLRPSGCCATSKNGFVVGPSGELYKCWHDTGNPEQVVGSISDESAWNMQLIARYATGTSYFDDPKCRECFYLPVCDGGCAWRRMRNKYHGGADDTCVIFSQGLHELLEIHYERKLKGLDEAQQGSPCDTPLEAL